MKCADKIYCVQVNFSNISELSKFLLNHLSEYKDCAGKFPLNSGSWFTYPQVSAGMTSYAYDPFNHKDGVNKVKVSFNEFKQLFIKSVYEIC